jgi:uncharacterized protein
MKYDVSHLIKEPTGSKTTYEIKQDSMEFDDFYASDIHGLILLIKTDIGIWLQGSANIHLKSQCVRCLNEFQKRFDIKFETQFYPSYTASTDMTGIEDSFIFNSDNMLDISDVFRQNVNVSAPMKPLCTDNCLGLCQSCGKNMNYDKCSCASGLNSIHSNDFSHYVNTIEFDLIKV